MRIRTTMVVLLAALGCAVEGDDGDADVEALAEAWCDLQARCATRCMTPVVDRDACVLQARVQFSPGPVAAETFGLMRSQACIDRVLAAMDELACDELETPWAWAERTCAPWHGAAGEGEECRAFEMPEQYVFVSVCAEGLTCAEDGAAGADAWRCRDVTRDPGEGEGCLRYQGGSVFEERCGDGLRCDAGVCVGGPGPGETCDCGGLFGCESCVGGYCDAEIGDAAGTCRAFAEVGEACGASVQPECAYICDPAELVCVAMDDPLPLACSMAAML
ncbi:MAG TPA: hypothetical protein VG755_35310 [Nannocystaceae bacterium]|nr:hypothetical protein [Nannocystaceae bacterium]